MPSHTHPHDQPQPDATPALAMQDPVCGMPVTAGSPFSAEYAGQTWYFCSAQCQLKFAAAPERYRPASAPTTPSPELTAESAAGEAEYSCPMHPEIRQRGPGTCPKCGMTLEPLLPELEEEQNPELRDFSRRFWYGLPLTLIVTLLAMGGHALNLFHGATQNWVELLLATPVVLWSGWPFYVRGVRSVIRRSPNMWTLIGLGTAAAYLYSLLATLIPQLFPPSFIQDGRIGVYFEAAAVIISLTLLGQMLELKARSQTSAAIKSLLGLAPKTARRIKAASTHWATP